MRLVEIVSHEKERASLLNHKAIVKVDDYNPATDKEALVEQVSIKVRYHPLGYGIYGQTTVAPYNKKEETYIVYWTTGTHCD